MSRFILLLTIMLCGFSPAQAESVLQNSIPWFEQDAHTGARLEALRLCRNDNRFYENKDTRPVCANAEAAENRLYWRQLKTGLNEVNTLRWWKENDNLRAAALAACNRRAPYDNDILQYCNVARQAQQERMTKVRG